MKEKIMITSVLCFGDKDKKTKLSYILIGKDRFSDNDNFKGYTPVDSWFNGIKAFNSVTKDLIGKPIEANFNLKPDYKNPLNTRSMLESLDNNGVIINLL